MPRLTSVLRDVPGLALVFAGGAVGTATRMILERAAPAEAGRWPVTTFLINLTGALALAALLEYLASSRVDEEFGRRLRLFGATGLCGGFTTYSTFAAEQTALVSDGHLPLALAYGSATVAGGIIGTVLGLVGGARLAARTAPSLPDFVDPLTPPDFVDPLTPPDFVDPDLPR